MFYQYLKLKMIILLYSYTFIIRLSRNRTYIRDLEGLCLNPLDDEPITTSYNMSDTGLEPVTTCL